MIRKQTLILLTIFVVLLGVVFYLQKNPLPSSTATITPSPTTPARLLSGWAESDITMVQFRDAQGNTTQVSLDEKGTWTVDLGKDGKKSIEAGVVEQLKAQIVSINVMATLPAGYALDAIGLQTPAHVLVVHGQPGKQAEIRIGSATPTDTGYYVQVNTQTPVVVDKNAVEGLLGQLKSFAPTPTPTAGTPAVSPGIGLTATATPKQ